MKFHLTREKCVVAKGAKAIVHVHAMIQKNSYGFNTFAATRKGEIQEGTSQTDWYLVESEHNIADCLTRGKKPSDIGLESTWHMAIIYRSYRTMWSGIEQTPQDLHRERM